MRNDKGIALIMAIGILAVLAVFGTGFALNMRLEYKAAMNYYHSVKSRYLAEMAAQVAIAKLRDRALRNAFDYAGGAAGTSDNWSADDYAAPATTSLEDTEQTSVTISDAASRININNASQQLLNNICDISINHATAGEMIYTERGTRIFTRKEELKQRVSDYFADEQNYAAIENFITTHSYVDNNTTPTPARSPVNINTASPQVIAAALQGIQSNGTASDGSTLAAALPINGSFLWNGTSAGALVVFIIANRPYTSWGEFDGVIDQARDDGTYGISPQQAEVIKYNCNPNHPKPSTYTAEFCFHSGGVYEVEATGRIYDSADSTVNPVSERKINLVAKVFDVYNETTKAQLEQGTPIRVTWLDSCPVESNELFGDFNLSLAGAKQVPGSIKIGFWDNFDEPVLTTEAAYNPNDEWDNSNGNFGVSEDWWSGIDSGTDRMLKPLIVGGTVPTFAKFYLNNGQRWTWTDFNLRVYERDSGRAPDVANPAGSDNYFHGGSQMRAVGWILFHAPPDPTTYGSSVNVNVFMLCARGRLEWGDVYDYILPTFSVNGDIVYQSAYSGYGVSGNWYDGEGIPQLSSTHQKMTNTQAAAYTIETDVDGDGTLETVSKSLYDYGTCIYGTFSGPWKDYRYMHKDQVRFWPDGPSGTEYYQEWNDGYTADKVYNLRVTDTTATGRVYNAASASHANDLTRTLSSGGSGCIGFYGHSMLHAWDDIRILSPNGQYTSKIINPIAGNVKWGTITATLTHPDSAVTSSLQGNSIIETAAAGISSGEVPLAAQKLNLSNNEFMALKDSSNQQYVSNTIQYKLFMTQHASDANMTETPVLEDVTITYLPKVEILAMAEVE